jgi:hypothetical protein
MNYSNPSYLLPNILIGSIVVVAATVFGLRLAVNRAEIPVRSRRLALWSISALLVAWFFTALALTWSGFYRGTPLNIPTIPFGLVIPVVAGILLFRRWPLLRRVVDSIPQSWIVGIQVYRVEGSIFLTLHAAGLLPGAFAWPAGIGDVLVGLLAPVAAVAYARRTRGSAGLVWAWNLLGLADLTVAVTTGFLTSPSPLQVLALDQPNELISSFPLAMIPVFLVPLSLLLHLASLKKLRATAGKPNDLFQAQLVRHS